MRNIAESRNGIRRRGRVASEIGTAVHVQFFECEKHAPQPTRNNVTEAAAAAAAANNRSETLRDSRGEKKKNTRLEFTNVLFAYGRRTVGNKTI